MQHVMEKTIAATVTATAPASTFFGFTMTANEWADTAIGAIGLFGFLFFQYQSMKDRREQREWNRKTERRKKKPPE